MKIIIKGDYNKVKQLLKELVPRCKRDKVNIEGIVDKTEKEQLENKKAEQKRLEEDKLAKLTKEKKEKQPKKQIKKTVKK